MSYIITIFPIYEYNDGVEDLEAEPKLTVWFGMGDNGPEVEDVEITDADSSPIRPTEAMRLALDEQQNYPDTFVAAAKEQGWKRRDRWGHL